MNSDADRLLHSPAQASHPPEKNRGDGKNQPLHHLTYPGFYKFICKNIQRGLERTLT